MRRSALVLACLLPCLASAAPTEAHCGVESQMLDYKHVLCTFPEAAEPRSYTFVARFSGGHDDTSARLEPTIDHKPMACDTGSKTDLFGEDGDVELHCRFAAPRAAGAELRVLIRWSHAEFTDFELVKRD